MRAYAAERIAIDATVGGKPLTVATYNAAGGSPPVKAVITVETQPIRYSLVAAYVPTATVGHLKAANDEALTIVGYNNITAFRAIQTGAGAAAIEVTYYR